MLPEYESPAPLLGLGQLWGCLLLTTYTLKLPCRVRVMLLFKILCLKSYACLVASFGCLLGWLVLVTQLCFCLFKTGLPGNPSLINNFPIETCPRDLPDGPVVETSPSNAGGNGLIPGWRATIPYVWWPKSLNIKQKQYCDIFNNDLKHLSWIEVEDRASV